MPLVPDPPDGVTMTSPDGRALAHMRSDAPRSAFDVEPAGEAGVDEVADVMAVELAGWAISAPPELALALAARGARLGRHAHLHSRDLRAEPPPESWIALEPPAGTRVEPVRGVDPDLAEAMEAAYPPGHPDREQAKSLEALAEVVSGRALGPLLSCSRVLVAADGRACAGSLITDRPGEPPWAGPWLTDMFRHPRRSPPGAGRLLLARSLAAAAAAGLPAVSLVVTDGNPARGIYDALGLRRITTTINVALA